MEYVALPTLLRGNEEDQSSQKTNLNQMLKQDSTDRSKKTKISIDGGNEEGLGRRPNERKRLGVSGTYLTSVVVVVYKPI